VLEIQRALIERSYLKDATGVYDKATVEAMKAFQAKENIPVTGYPTAHALQRLKLSPSPTSISSATPQAGVPPDANQSKEQ
jgi:peptidoglycan hydrolase-like protein with peptidoglycan-binding domain